MKVELIEAMGSDLTVVNTARVSFGKTVTELDDKDIRLIRYLAEHGHWSPFAHTCLQFRIKAPIFVARQLAKHQIGLVWNEVSRRYVKSEIEFYEPLYWRKADKDIKQGSSAEDSKWEPFRHYYEDVMEAYNEAMDEGVCPEQARMLLPQSMMTEWIWTGSLQAFARVVEQRTHPTAQRETREIAYMLKEAIAYETYYPYSWQALMSGVKD